MDSLFKEAIHKSTRGHDKKFFKGHAQKFVRSNFFLQRTINDWNALPNHLVNESTLESFKTKLDIHWKEHWFII